MKKIFFILLTIFLAASTAIAKQATKEEAKNLVNKAVAAIKEDKNAALAKISSPDGGYYFKEKALYAFVYDENCVIKAHPFKPSLIGISYKGKPDIKGKKFRDEIVEKALKDGEGWIDYSYQKPEEKGIHTKTAYFKLVEKDGNKYIVVAGVYK